MKTSFILSVFLLSACGPIPVPQIQDQPQIDNSQQTVIDQTNQSAQVWNHESHRYDSYERRQDSYGNYHRFPETPHQWQICIGHDRRGPEVRAYCDRNGHFFQH